MELHVQDNRRAHRQGTPSGIIRKSENESNITRSHRQGTAEDHSIGACQQHTCPAYWPAPQWPCTTLRWHGDIDTGGTGGTGVQGYKGTGVQGVQGYRGTGVKGHMGTGVHGVQGYRGIGVQGYTGTWVQGVHGYRGTGVQEYRGTGNTSDRGDPPIHPPEQWPRPRCTCGPRRSQLCSWKPGITWVPLAPVGGTPGGTPGGYPYVPCNPPAHTLHTPLHTLLIPPVYPLPPAHTPCISPAYPLHIPSPPPAESITGQRWLRCSKGGRGHHGEGGAPKSSWGGGERAPRSSWRRGCIEVIIRGGLANTARECRSVGL